MFDLKRNYRLTFFCLLLVGISCGLQGQNPNVPIGSWRDHLSYRKGLSVAKANGKVYCVAESGVFVLKLEDNSLQRFSKINGLSDMGAQKIKYNPYNGTLLITYKNANIDIIQDNTIINISDIKQKPIVGAKTINDVFFINQYAFLSCGFGIVVLDTEKKEIKDTYYIGPNGTNINVNSITTDTSYIYAATDNGIYQAPINSSFLANYSTWTLMSGLPNGAVSHITTLQNKIYFSINKSIHWYNADSSKWLNKTDWMKIRNLESHDDKLIVTYENGVEINDKDVKATMWLSYLFSGLGPSPYQCVVDTENNCYWIGDNNNGLVKFDYKYWSTNCYYPNGPYQIDNRKMAAFGGKLIVAPGNVENFYVNHGFFLFENGEWKLLDDPGMDTMSSVVNVAIDPKDPSRFYACTYHRGLMELKDNQLKYTYGLGTLPTVVIPNYYSTRVGGLAFDEDNNLWISCAFVKKILAVKKTDGTFLDFDFSFLNPYIRIFDLMVTSQGQKWIMQGQGDGIIVYDDKGTFATPSTSNTKKLQLGPNLGNLPSNEVLSFAEDLENDIWVGTDKGLAVFYNPENIFNGGNYDAQTILIEQDGLTQVLLETEAVSCIAVDGANRKWIGTRNSGAYLMSADGTRQIFHFDAKNSPILSNNINCIAIDHESGEVFFGTESGICSFKGTATEGYADYKNVYAYPNPVKPDYTGSIAIRGLVSDVNVKIADISGNLVYETKALGGQAIWDGKNFKGERVQTGVYLVFCTDDKGDKTFVTKILFIN